ncbi:MAG: UDP-N-acetylmuramoyl-L-alanyl-D-glutamate--2,6-diaminopimelate ligase [Parcubacteria group bacterium]|jgi:UDP-N-acetylmuramoyl-L-alanyl-D-glutamate--2,6-diaminopimelate ligase
MIPNGAKKLVPQSIKNIYHLFQAVFANVWFGFPSRNLKVIGVTGTNGKTTTVQMIAKVLEEAGHPAKPDGNGAGKIAVASTINFKIGEKEWVNDTKFTTFSSFKLQAFLKKAAEAGCEYAIVEVTSHALDQNRVFGIDFSVAVITNVSREHLDYHKTIERYSRAKEKLFAMAAKNKNGAAVVNLNMKFADNFLKYGAGDKYGYHLGNQESGIRNQGINTIKAENIKLGINQSEFIIHNSRFVIHTPGDFNVENALAATCVGLSQGISLEKISEALAMIKGVPGRMERIENNCGLEIIVDYAVTPDSLEKLYVYLGKLKKESNKIIAVFGSCGERDRGKRPIMGEIVAKAADYCIVTNEDPYGEDPIRIINEVFEGVTGQKVEREIPNFQFSIFNFQKSYNSQISKSKTEGMNAFRILDRKEAIKTALQIAKPGDIIAVTGKGAEEIMAVGKKRIPWNDPKMIREILQELETKQIR